jgi:hypothetical protein
MAEIPCGVVDCAGGHRVLRLREPLALPMARFAQDDKFVCGSWLWLRQNEDWTFKYPNVCRLQAADAEILSESPGSE